MSTVLVLTPVVIGGWPAISAAAVGAASALGLVVKQSVKEAVKQHSEVREQVEQSVEVSLEESEVLGQNLVTGQEIVLTRDNVQLTVKRDERGRCSVCASGKGLSKTELKNIAEEFTQKMTQCFVYNRVASELKNKGFQVIEEEVMEDESVRLHVRRWVD